MTKEELLDFIENALDHNKLEDGSEIIATHAHAKGDSKEMVLLSVVSEDDVSEFQIHVKEM